ncbi:type II toxin-antitoxin system VapC family toxin [cf. Phormidesmis sp. LEGE 11477]|uniref:type II toxin-antitoxin system VapC family toxin n=1 Tax=cf. Phormidesmis sp. LEGE 11477 TaxID=1828680 RepID=UPI00187E3624|nr:type II toxin-antitoxin system VapC family toxin [cf. Phormidesmis sp. LEGE 11477]MBE9064059.1 type II toxin-antitoxin system VapC family toxin [cf. Phormidesmis sp. LEGE 11477]
MYLLDTNHCSRIIAGDRVLIEQLQEHEGDGIATSAIVRGELLFMVQKSERQAENLQAVASFLRSISLYPISGAVADVYGRLKGDIVNQLGPKDKAQRRKTTVQGLGFSDNDLWIAATVLHYDLTLVSLDRDFQRLQLVQVFSLESWL